MNREVRSPGIVFWGTVLASSALVLYPLSFGPACWISSQVGVGANVLPTVYRPLLGVMSRDKLRRIRIEETDPYQSSLSSSPLEDGLLAWYAALWAERERIGSIA